MLRLNVTLRRDKKERARGTPFSSASALPFPRRTNFSSPPLFFLSLSPFFFTYFLRKVKRFISLRGSARLGFRIQRQRLVSLVDKLSGTLPFDFPPLSPQFRTLNVLTSLCPFLPSLLRLFRKLCNNFSANIIIVYKYTYFRVIAIDKRYNTE